MIPSAPSSAENLSLVPVRERGSVPINKTILESRRKSPFCSHPLCFPTLYFYKRASPRPTAFTQRSQLHIVAAVHTVLVLAAPPTLAPEQAGSFQQAHQHSNELSAGGREGVAFKQKSPRPTHAPRPPMGGKNTQQRHCKEQAWRPGASDTGLLCAGAWPLPATGASPSKKKKQVGVGVAEARWSDEGKPDRCTDTSLFQESQEQGGADPKERRRKGEDHLFPVHPAPHSPQGHHSHRRGQREPSGLTASPQAECHQS